MKNLKLPQACALLGLNQVEDPPDDLCIRPDQLELAGPTLWNKPIPAWHFVQNVVPASHTRDSHIPLETYAGSSYAILHMVDLNICATLYGATIYSNPWRIIPKRSIITICQSINQHLTILISQLTHYQMTKVAVFSSQWSTTHQSSVQLRRGGDTRTGAGVVSRGSPLVSIAG